MLDSLSWVRCSLGESNEPDLRAEISELSLVIHQPSTTPRAQRGV